MVDEQKIITQKEYDLLLLKTIENKTLTNTEIEKMIAYENEVARLSNSSGLGQSKILSTTAGKNLSEHKDNGLAIALLIVLGAIASGIGTALLLLNK